MPSIEYDLRYLRAGAEVLEQYLLGDELYYPMNAEPPLGEPPYPRLTLGALALARLRLGAHALTPVQERDLADSQARLDHGRSHWRSAWSNKATEEFRARLFLWRNFLEAYRRQPEANYDRYPFEASRRVQLHLLPNEALEIPDHEIEMLSSLDEQLRSLLTPGDFIWNTEMQIIFPADTYWYLYGRLDRR